MKNTVARLTTTLKSAPRTSSTVVLLTGGSPLRDRRVAGAVAGELRLALQAVDLSRIVSRYIGETEKNIDRVFSDAVRTSAVLFFDEADALFGKRTDVADSHDRFDNAETNYLLQRIEQHAGIIVLAVNSSTQADAIGKKFRRAKTVVVSAGEDKDDD